MATAKKMGLFPDQKYIQDGLREGWITIQEISMKGILVDTSFQARAKHLDMNHVHKLAMMRDNSEGQGLSPVVVFDDPESQMLILADGFHRHEENRIRKMPSIRACVAKVDEPRRAALEFATMCNQELCLGRSREDVKKAVWMLFGIKEWRHKSNSLIADHIGCSPGTINKYKSLYHDEKKIPLPDKVVFYDVTVSSCTKEERTTPVAYKVHHNASGRKQFFANVGGKSFGLGHDREKAEAALAQIVQELPSFVYPANQKNFEVMLKTNHLKWETCGMEGAKYPNCDCIVVENHLCTFIDFKTSKDIPGVVGRLHLAAQFKELDSSTPKIAICYPDEGPQDFIKLAQQIGIEFLTPLELVARLKGEEPQSSATEAPDTGDPNP